MSILKKSSASAFHRYQANFLHWKIVVPWVAGPGALFTEWAMKARKRSSYRHHWLPWGVWGALMAGECLDQQHHGHKRVWDNLECYNPAGGDGCLRVTAKQKHTSMIRYMCDSITRVVTFNWPRVTSKYTIQMIAWFLYPPGKKPPFPIKREVQQIIASMGLVYLPPTFTIKINNSCR